MPSSRALPVVLVLAGHDPTGGAGLIADREAVAACGGWAVTVPTALTVQSCRDVRRVVPVEPALIGEMVAELDEFAIGAIKVGLLASAETLEAVVDVIQRFPDAPVVLDPVLTAGGGKTLSTESLIEACRARLLPHVDISTPNRLELMHLSAEGKDDAARAAALMDMGCRAVLVTGTDAPAEGVDPDIVEQVLFTPQGEWRWRWPRLPHRYHGSGCTLAAALAARLAAGDALALACERAQSHAWRALSRGWQPGEAQWLPQRAGPESVFHRFS
ncbi:bifunctional hydroxymethylpyrimidine kinase/phosphomethylpyrimidine kinase [Billgrantia gudaonensis]|uniref:hydroxymethylpyrimidine kinase n=1 Tax=Billgrantia gudaonensis TaxID=376427 RepID=A0A1G8PFK5_9GAMM|nr:hydroxymethylpyrimidine/phosphomethylpyrimidine kinase [Halomonas gudaonensis]SDI91106.1 hydroxymethylpyrimidine/phosphomethylpyrimidine kinase [Halomonas gudaonensis]